MCLHSFLFTGYSRICRNCGVEQSELHLDKYNACSAPLERGYNRRQRFKTKVTKLLGLHSGPPFKDPIWKHLATHRVTLNTPADCRECLRHAVVKNKHYDSVRTFSDTFTSFRVTVDQQHTYSEMLTRFDKVFSMWTYYNQPSFFSYDWLLRYFLEAIQSPLVVYLKPPTCRTRHDKYINLLETIRSLRKDGTRCRVTSSIPPPSDSTRSETPHSQGRRLLRLAVLGDECHAPGGLLHSWVNRRPSQKCTSSKLPDGTVT